MILWVQHNDLCATLSWSRMSLRSIIMHIIQRSGHTYYIHVINMLYTYYIHIINIWYVPLSSASWNIVLCHWIACIGNKWYSTMQKKVCNAVHCIIHCSISYIAAIYIIHCLISCIAAMSQSRRRPSALFKIKNICFVKMNMCIWPAYRKPICAAVFTYYIYIYDIILLNRR